MAGVHNTPIRLFRVAFATATGTVPPESVVRIVDIAVVVGITEVTIIPTRKYSL
eukprot:CAMPEP_0115300512 /NCGR_PEP_ID=MMETSP0270-20121206/69373_1 /TAXON_ID=71861 /ORGANISM="Scrippsiella trochoidea, Strain CCMP3099" /LENGTH=53 /DNA_ID=CAMNT_0002718345 /DNA_START=49 /DNA_END=210 /DNA_ORIENTATION=-